MRALLLFILSFNVFSMCDFPHNPPVLCLNGSVKKKLSIKHKKFNCKLVIKTNKLVRPKNTYRFTDGLVKEEFRETLKLNKSEVIIYSKDNCDLNKITTTVRYNCNDLHSDIKDMELIDLSQERGNVYDHWREKSTPLDCRSVLSTLE